MKSIIGNRIKKLRESLGLSQTDFAKKLETSYQRISEYERGLVSPSVDMLLKLRNIFSADINDLLTNKEPDKAMMVAESLSVYYTNQEKEYIDKLVTIFRTKKESTIVAITTNIDEFLKLPDKAPLEKKKAG